LVLRAPLPGFERLIRHRHGNRPAAWMAFELSAGLVDFDDECRGLTGSQG
jgi:hypothetical protein